MNWRGLTPAAQSAWPELRGNGPGRELDTLRPCSPGCRKRDCGDPDGDEMTCNTSGGFPNWQCGARGGRRGPGTRGPRGGTGRCTATPALTLVSLAWNRAEHSAAFALADPRAVAAPPGRLLLSSLPRQVPAGIPQIARRPVIATVGY